MKKNTLKKLLSLSAAAALALSLTACGGGGEAENTNTSSSARPGARCTGGHLQLCGRRLS